MARARPFRHLGNLPSLHVLNALITILYVIYNYTCMKTLICLNVTVGFGGGDFFALFVLLTTRGFVD